MTKSIKILLAGFDILALTSYGITRTSAYFKAQGDGAAINDFNGEVSSDLMGLVGNFVPTVITEPSKKLQLLLTIANVIFYISLIKTVYNGIDKLITYYSNGSTLVKVLYWIAFGLCVLVGAFMLFNVFVVNRAFNENVYTDVKKFGSDFYKKQEDFIQAGILFGAMLCTVIPLGYMIYKEEEERKDWFNYLVLCNAAAAVTCFKPINKMLAKKPKVYFGTHGVILVSKGVEAGVRNKRRMNEN